MPARSRLINLLPQSEFEKSFGGRFLKWAISAGRKVIIVTELIVILAFLSRFKLDEDIRVMNDEITGKRNLLESTMQFETDFLNKKNEISSARDIEKRQSGAATTLEEVARVVPFEVRLKDLLLTKTGANMTGLSIDEKALGEMLSRMDKNPDWKSVDLATLDAQENKGVSFVLNVYK